MSEVMLFFRAQIAMPSGQVSVPFTATSEGAAQEFVGRLEMALDADIDLLGPWETP